MSRDFARSASPSRGRARTPPRSAKGPFLLGLTLGLTVALGVFLVDHGYVHLDELFGETPTASNPPQPRANPAARPRFDFYTILPEMEVVIPEEPAAEIPPERPVAPREARSDVASPPAREGGYVLQAGSFRSAADADGLKAQLALLGYQASIQTVTINQDTYHRVRLGPYATRERADAARARLNENDVATMLLRLKG
ncbi:MAG: SPOR domain-containing protein [Gammaproteobacteria bacterium]|nr:SPOR domain-containing protein [Gammaproteobacteria bacterium]